MDSCFKNCIKYVITSSNKKYKQENIQYIIKQIIKVPLDTIICTVESICSGEANVQQYYTEVNSRCIIGKSQTTHEGNIN